MKPSLDFTTFLVPVPLPALLGAIGTGLLAALIIFVSRKFDHTGGLLTLSILIVVAFIQATFVSMIYEIPQSPLVEILIGALSTSLGAVVAFWMSGSGHRGE